VGSIAVFDKLQNYTFCFCVLVKQRGHESSKTCFEVFLPDRAEFCFHSRSVLR